jgi:8-oxo-dGTP pyrophosphatase MutT (NUDIX family)
LVLELPEGFRRAAVLIPLVYHEKEWFLIFTRRTDLVSHHKNEISFPGGRHDDKDKDLIHTAQREVHEELGIKDVHILGLIDDIPTISQYIVTPVIGYIPEREKIDFQTENTPEIAYILEATLSYLTNHEIFSVKEREWRGLSFRVPFFDYKGEIIWGATGRILVNLLKTLNLLNRECRLEIMNQNGWYEEYDSRIDLTPDDLYRMDI